MALNKLKKWIGTQAMTAFFDQLNDNVDATNAAIDLAETNSTTVASLLAGGETYNITLQNEWSGILSYQINDLNQVTLTLDATSGPSASSLEQIAALPAVIRPTTELMWIVDDTTLARAMVLNIRQGGGVRISQGTYQSIRENTKYQGQIIYQI